MNQKILGLLSLAALTWSSSAFAIHAYRSETCRSNTHILEYQGNYPVGGNYSLKRIDRTDKDSRLALPNEAEIYGEELNEADVVFKTLSQVKTSPELVNESECFEHTEWNSRQVIKFEKVSLGAMFKLGILPGSTMTFECAESTDYPIECTDL